MGSAAEALAEIVGDGAHVGSGGDAGAEAGVAGIDGGNGEFFYFYLDWLKFDLFVLAGEFVGGDAVNFFGGEWRRSLLGDAEEFACELLKFRKVEEWAVHRGCLTLRAFSCGEDLLRLGGRGTGHDGIAIGVVGGGGEAEANYALVSFFGGGVELNQAGEAAEDERKNSGGEGIEGAEMSDGALAENAAHAVDDVMGGPTGGLIDDDDAVHEKIVRLSDRVVERLKMGHAFQSPADSIAQSLN